MSNKTALTNPDVVSINAPQGRRDRAWAEINLTNLVHNARVLKMALPPACDIMAVVKANAYGHGDITVSKTLAREGINVFAVATLDEGVNLRKNGIRGEILILGYTDPKRADELSRYGLIQTITDAQYAGELNGSGRTVKAHIKVDTGMHRLGESYENTAMIAQIFGYAHLSIGGIYTHLCAADGAGEGDRDFTALQIQRFNNSLGGLKSKGITSPKTHILSSSGVLSRCDVKCDYARIGLALYGASGTVRYDIDIKPVLSLKARVSHLSRVAAGESVGYNRAFTAKRDTLIAVIAIGYADGIPRSLSGRGEVLIRGRRAPIAGLICMDQLMADVTDIANVKSGDVATLIGSDGGECITADEMSLKAGTIPNELFSRLGSRIERIAAY